MQTTYMWYVRSGYLAADSQFTRAVRSLSTWRRCRTRPTYLPWLLRTGAQGSDALIVDFSDASHTWEMDIKSQRWLCQSIGDEREHA